MRQEDRDFLKQFERRLDDRHESFVTYISEEFERMSRHHSKVNDRITTLEVKVDKNTTWRTKITAAVTAVAAALGFIIIRFTVIIDNIKQLIKHN